MRRTAGFTLRPLLAAGLALAFFDSSQAAPAVSYQVRTAAFISQNATCDAELWLPKGVQKPPVIVMAHGFGALKSWGLDPFAERFVKAGFAVMRFDYRGFGRSGGEPRRVVDGREQVKDWLAAVESLQHRGDIDPKRLGIWGTSFSGGEVLVVAAQRAGTVKAVSAQVPMINGFQSALRFPIKYYPLAAWYATRDWLRKSGDTPVYVPIISRDGFAALSCKECAEGYGRLVPPGMESENKVAARFVWSLPFFRPAESAPNIRIPTLLIAAEQDGLIPIAGIREMVPEMSNVDYMELQGADHFSLYTGPVFEKVVDRQVTFFRRNLGH